MKGEGVSTPALRRWRVLAGDRRQALARLAEALRGLPPDRCWWFGDQAPPGVRPLSCRDVQGALGSECDLLVYDAQAGLYPDVLAALLGTLRGGGELLLLAPAWNEWPAFQDPALERLAPWPLDGRAVGRRFVRRLQRELEQAGPDRIQSAGQPVKLALPSAPEWVPLTLTEDQQRAVDAIERAALGHARRPLVLLADRGRGKSTAIGSALARLLAQRSKRIRLLAPSPAAVAAVFDQLARELPQGNREGEAFRHHQGEVRFCRPAEYLAENPACDLLVADEAAALGVPLLQQLCERHNRLVFSTTVHGYEGSGRGFVTRFARYLDGHFRQWKRLVLQQPVRWAAGDPLEALTDRLFLLSAEPNSPSQPPPQAGEGVVGDAQAGEQQGFGSQPRYRWLSQDALAGDETLLSGVYGLLVGAHYQTRPSDLQQLLDGPGLRILAALEGGQPVGVLLVVEEGGMPAELAEAIAAGRRRPRGHQLAQSLAAHGGYREAPRLHLWRVMRIAVAEQVRRQGIGSGLLETLRQQAMREKVDLLGASFGLEVGLLRFWLANGYRPVRVGHRHDPASAARSVQMLFPLSASGEALNERAVTRFQRDLPLGLGGGLGDLPPEAVAPMLAGRDLQDLPLTVDDLDDLHRFARGERDIRGIWPVLWRWAVHRLAEGEAGNDEAGVLVPLLQGPTTGLGERERERLRVLVEGRQQS